MYGDDIKPVSKSLSEVSSVKVSTLCAMSSELRTFRIYVRSFKVHFVAVIGKRVKQKTFTLLIINNNHAQPLAFVYM